MTDTIRTQSELQTIFADNLVGNIDAQDLRDFLVSSNLSTGQNLISFNSAASTSALLTTGIIFTGGTGTTNFPHVLIQPTGTTASTIWSVNGTALGINVPTGYTGNIVDFQIAGVSRLNLSAAGAMGLGGTLNCATVNSTNRIISTYAAGASLAVYNAAGALYAAGTGTTNFPQYFSQSTGTSAVTTWSTSGTYFGVNAASGFAGNFLDFHANGSTSLFSVGSGGQVNTASTINTSANSAASTPAMLLTGTPYSAGTTTTNFPHFLIQPSGATPSTTWAAAGTNFGINGVGTNSMIDCKLNGSSVFSISSGGSINMNGAITTTRASAASTATFLLTGAIVTGQTGTTNFPHIFMQPSGATAVTTWSTSGTALGMNLASGFGGNFLDFRINGGAQSFVMTSGGHFSCSGNLGCGASQVVAFNGRSGIRSSSDGTIQFRNNANSADASITCSGITATNSSTPASSSDTGVAGQMAWDASFEYRCIATNTWKRVAIATW